MKRKATTNFIPPLRKQFAGSFPKANHFASLNYCFAFISLFISQNPKMASKENCKESVLKYLINQNRPYSANDVMQNLHKEFGKTAIQKALDDLTSECKIREKVYGKQKVYSVIQEEETAGEDVSLQLATLDSRIEELGEKLKSNEQELKAAEGALRELESEPSTEKATEEKTELEAAVGRLRERIDTLSKTSLEKSFTEKERTKISKDHENYTKAHRKRKQICMDIVNSIMENYPKKLKLLLEEIGVEVDEVS